MNEEKSKNYKQMADDWVKNLKIQYVPELPATLFQDDHLVAAGLVAISKDDVVFLPTPPKLLDCPLHGKVSVRVTKTGDVINLKHSHGLLDVSDNTYWFFER